MQIREVFHIFMTENFLNLMREKVTKVQETQCPKQDEPKEAHSTMCHNLNGKI